jgi:taurine dioxygenase
VAQHPVTGRKSLYLPLCHIESVVDLSEDESRELLTDLQTHATQPPFTYMHVWQPGDLVLWDNRCALHAPTPFDDTRHLRLMYRLTVNGQQIVGF